MRIKNFSHMNDDGIFVLPSAAPQEPILPPDVCGKPYRSHRGLLYGCGKDKEHGDDCGATRSEPEADILKREGDQLRAKAAKFRGLTISLLHRLTLNHFTDCAEMDEARAALKETP